MDSPAPVAPARKRLADYRPPDWLVPDLALRFELDADRTLVHARMQVRRNGSHPAPLRLDGEELELLSLTINGVARPQNASPEGLVLEIDGVPAILDLVAGGAGCAVLSRNAVASAPRPAAFSVRRIETARAPTLQIRLYTAVSALRPTTRTQQAALALVRASAAERFDAL